MSNKPSLDRDKLQQLVRREFSDTASALEQLVEGEESQAFSFTDSDKAYVLRVHITEDGFKKDAYAFENFTSGTLPIPEVYRIGSVDASHAFCISQKLPGITLQDANEEAIEKLLEATNEVLTAIHDSVISTTSGYGSFTIDGTGKFGSWHEFLISVLAPSADQWDTVRERSDPELIDDIVREFESLLPYCPEERRLLHADFGSNNVLTDGTRITGVLDWETASYGDPVFDMGGFWSTWLMCVRKQSAYWDEVHGHLLHYQERKHCYDLRMALAEIYENALDGGTDTLRWVENRSREILRS